MSIFAEDCKPLFGRNSGGSLLNVVKLKRPAASIRTVARRTVWRQSIKYQRTPGWQRSCDCSVSLENFGVANLPISPIEVGDRSGLMSAEQKVHTAIFRNRLIQSYPKTDYWRAFGEVEVSVILVPRLLSADSGWLQ